MCKNKGYLIFFLVSLMIVFSSLGAFAAQDLRIEQKLPDGIFLNDADGQSYAVTITNIGEAITGDFPVTIGAPLGFGGAEVTAVSVGGTTLQDGQYSVSGNTITIHFDGEFTLGTNSAMKLDFTLPTTATKIADFGDNPHLTITAGGVSDQEPLYDLIKPGVLSVLLQLKDPTQMPVHRDDFVDIIATISNLGEGDLFNTVLKLNMGGYSIVEYPDEIKELFNGDGSITIPNLEGGSETIYVFKIKVSAYKDFDLIFTGENDANEKGEVASSLPITFAIRQPKVTMSIPESIKVEYGSNTEVNIKIANGEGYGAAREFTLTAENLPADYISNVSDGWSYDDTTSTFTYNDKNIPENGSVNLTFDFSPPLGDHHKNPSGLIVFKPNYKNDEDRPFSSPVKTANYSVINPPTLDLSLAVTKLEADSDIERIFLEQPIDLTYTIKLTEEAKWQKDGNIVFEATLPVALEFRDENPVIETGVGTYKIDGKKVIWTLSYAEAKENPTIKIETLAVNDPAKAGSTYDVTATVTGTRVCGVPLSDTMNYRFLLQSRDDGAKFVYQTKEYINLPEQGSYNIAGSNNGEMITYELKYEFCPESGGKWTGSSLIEDFAGKQTYVGDIKYRVGSTDDFENIPTDITVTHTENRFVLPLDFLKDKTGQEYVKGQVIYFQYTTKLDESKFDADDRSGRFTPITTLRLNGASGGHEVNGIHQFYQGVFVPYSRASLTVDVDYANTVTKGESPIPVTVTIGRNTPKWPIHDLIVTVDLGDGYSYLENVSYTDNLAGKNPQITYEDNKVVFNFDKTVVFNDDLGSINFDVVKTCSDNWDIKVNLSAKDEVNKDLSASNSKSPQLKLAGELELSAPTPVIVSAREFDWELVVTNTGSGIAHNVHVIADINEIITIGSSSMDGASFTEQQWEQEAIANGMKHTWILDAINPGESKTIKLTSTVSKHSQNFDIEVAKVQAKQGWVDKNRVLYFCPAAEPKVLPSFVEPQPQVFVKNHVSEHIKVSHDGIIEIQIKNNGAVNAYDLTIIQDLKNSGLVYKNDSAKIGDQSINDPKTDDGKLTWDTTIEGLQQILNELAIGDSITLSFGVYASEQFNASDRKISAEVKWESPSGKKHAWSGADYWVPRHQPNINVTVTGKNDDISDSSYSPRVVGERGNTVTWQIEIKNTGDATARNVLLQNVLPNNMFLTKIFDSSDEQLVEVSGKGWKLQDIPVNATVTYYVRGTIDSAQKEETENVASVSWGDDSTYSAESRLTSPGKPMGKATLVTQPKLVSVSHNFTDLTTKTGKVTITFTSEDLPMHDFKLEHVLGDRYQILPNTIVYSDAIKGENVPTKQPGVGAFGTLEWNWGTIPVGTHSITFDVRDYGAGAGNGAELDSLVKVDYANSNENPQANDRGQGQHSLKITPKKAMLDVTKTPIKQIVGPLDEEVAWTITVRNTGNSTATNLEIIDTIGSGFTYKSVDGAMGTPSQTADDGATILTWTINNLAPNASVSATIKATLTEGGNHFNEVKATEWNIDKTAQVDSKNTTAYVAGFVVEKTASTAKGPEYDNDADAPGEIVEFTITAKFLADDHYKNIVIVDTLPDGLEYVSHTEVANVTVIPPTSGGKTLMWEIADFNAKQEIALKYQARIVKEGIVSNGKLLTNHVDVSFDVGYTGKPDQQYRPTDLSKLKTKHDLTFKEPIAKLTRTSDVTGDDSDKLTAGQNIKHTLTIENTGGAPLYGLKLSELVPEGVRVAGIQGLVVKNGEEPLIENTHYTYTYNASTGKMEFTFKDDVKFGVLQPNQTITIEYTTTVDSSIGSGSELTYTGRVEEYYSQPSGILGRASYGPLESNTKTYMAIASTISKNVTTSRVSGLKVTPGDVVDYEVTFVAPKRTNLYNVVLTETFDPEIFAFVEGSFEIVSPQTSGAFAYAEWKASVNGGELNLFAPKNGEDDVAHILNNAVDSEDITFTLKYQLRVLDDAAKVVTGAQPKTSLNYSFNTIVGAENTRKSHHRETTLTVIEPVLQVTLNEISTGDYQAGSEVQYQVTVSHTDQSGSDAYNLDVEFDFPEGIVFEKSSVTPKEGTTGARKLKFTKENLNNTGADSSYTFTITGVVQNQVQPKETLESAVSVSWTSVPTEVYARKYTGTTGSSATHTISIADKTALTSSVDILDKEITEHAVIGKIVEYEAVITLTRGETQEVKFSDVLPEGFSFIQATIKSRDGIAWNTQMQKPEKGQVGTITWDFGTVSNPFSADGQDDTITITYQVQILDVPSNETNSSKQNGAKLEYKSFTATAENKTDKAAVLTIAEPKLEVQTAVVDTKGSGETQAGDVLKYTVVITNNGTSEAFDVALDIDLDSGVVYKPGATVGGTINEPNTGANNKLAWNNLGSIEPGESITIVYSAEIQDTVGPNQELKNNANVVAFSLPADPETEGQVRRKYSESDATATITTGDSNVISKITQSNTFTESGSQVRVGDVITYTVEIDLQKGLTEGLALTETLPNGLVYLGTVSINGQKISEENTFSEGNGYKYDPIATGAIDEGQIKWNLGDITNPSTRTETEKFTIIYQVQVVDDEELGQDPDARGISLANMLELSYENSQKKPQGSTNVVVVQPELIVKEVDSSPKSPEVVQPGDEIEHTIVVKNEGSGPAYDLQIDVFLPEDLRDGGIQNLKLNGEEVDQNKVTITEIKDEDGELTGGYTITIKDTELPSKAELTLTYTTTVNDTVTGDAVGKTSVTVEEYHSMTGVVPEGATKNERRSYGPSCPKQDAEIPLKDTTIVVKDGEVETEVERVERDYEIDTEDIVIKIRPYGKTLKEIKIGDETLGKGQDYTVTTDDNGDLVITISKGYLDSNKPSDLDLEFVMNHGQNPTAKISITPGRANAVTVDPENDTSVMAGAIQKVTFKFKDIESNPIPERELTLIGELSKSSTVQFSLSDDATGNWFESLDDLLQNHGSLKSDQSGAFAIYVRGTHAGDTVALTAQMDEVEKTSGTLTIVANTDITMKFSQQPQDTEAGDTLQQVKVKITDKLDNPISGVPVTIAINTGPDSAELEGTLVVNTNEDGEAIFNDLVIGNVGEYTLKANSESLESISDSFKVTYNRTVTLEDPGLQNTSKPILDGATNANKETDTVTVTLKDKDGTESRYEATITDEGTWNLQIPDELKDGEYEVTVIVSDKYGNSSEKTTGTLVIDTVAPKLTVEDQTTNNQTPTITGTINPEEGADKVEVVVRDEENSTVFKGEATVDEGGNWSIAIPADKPLGEGEYTVEATYTDAAGNTGDAEGKLIIDLTKPELTVEDQITNNPTPTITGTGDPEEVGGDVHVVITTKDGTAVFEGNATIDGHGKWSVDVDKPLAEDGYDVTATYEDKAGNEVTAKGDLTIDLTDPSLTVDDQITNNPTPTITGTSDPEEAGREVEIAITDGDGQEVFSGTGTIDEDGNWSVDVNVPLDDGNYTVDATYTDKAGNQVEAEGNLSIDTEDPTLEVEDQVTNNATPTITGTINPEEGADKVEVVVRDKDGNIVFEGEATVDGDGNWSISIPDTDPLGEGKYTVEATYTDEAGNTGNAEGELIIDLTEPELTVEDQTTNNQTPIITGTSDEIGETVFVTIKDGDNNEIFTGTAVVDEEGEWSLNVSTELQPDDYTVHATITDRVGNEATAEGHLKIVLSENTDIEKKQDDDDRIIAIDNGPEDRSVEIVAGTTVDEFVQAITSTDGSNQTYKVLDENGNEKDPSEPLQPGDVLIVTAENGEDTAEYEVVLVGTESPVVQVTLKTDKNGHKPGETITYTATVENAGPRLIDDVILTTVIPEGTTFVPGFIKINGVVVNATDIELITDTGELAVKIPDLAVGDEYEVEYSLKVDSLPDAPYAGNKIDNKVRLTYSTVLADIHQTISNTVSVSVEPEYSVDFSAGRTIAVVPGGEAIFKHTITNGSNDGDTFLIEVDGGEELEITWYYDLNGDGKLDEGDMPLEVKDGVFVAGPLGAYESTDLIMVAKTPEGHMTGEETLNVTVVSNKDKTVTTTVQDTLVVTDAAPSITIDGPEVGVYAGDPFELEIEYGNEGTDDLEGAEVVITLDPNAVFVDASVPGAVYDPNTHTVTIPVGTLLPGDKDNVKITFTTDKDLKQGNELKIEAEIKVGDVTLGDAEKELLVSNKQPSFIRIESEHDLIVGDGESTTEITAYVIDLLGNPVDDGEVTFTTAEGKFAESTSKTATVQVRDGRASLTLVSPKISSTVPVRIPVVVSAMNKDAGQVSARIDIVFSPGALTGRLINSETGLPETGVLMRLIKDDGIILETYTDEYGYYVFDVPATGEYYVAAIQYDEDDNEIEIGCVTNVAKIDDNTLSYGPRIIQGRIVDRRTGTGFSEILAYLYDENGKLIAETTTDKNGNYIFRVDLALNEQGKAGMQSMAMINNMVSSGFWRVVGVTNSGHTVQRTIKPLKPGDVLLNVGLFVDSGGIVTDKLTGDPIKDAQVKLIHAGGPYRGQLASLPLLHGVPQIQPSLTDANGIYRITASPGSYVLAVSAVGYHTLVSPQFDVSGEVMIDAELTPMGVGDLTVKKTATRELVDAGGENEFTLTITNTTGFSIDKVDIKDTLPLGVSYVEDSGTEGIVQSGNTLAWTLLNLKPGVHELKYSVKVDANVAAGKVLVNNVTAQMHGHPVPAEGTASFTVAAWPQMDLEITTDKTTAEVGERIRYEVKLKNNPAGVTPMVSTETWLEVVLPEGFVYQPNTSMLNRSLLTDPVVDGNVLRWNVGEINPGDELRLTFATTVTIGVADSDNITKAYADGTSQAGYPYRFGPAQVRVVVQHGVFGNRGTILGTVFIDSNENGIQDLGEPGVAGVEIYLDHGYMVTTDEFGLYSIGSMLPGTRSMTVASWSLPEGYEVAWGGEDKAHASKFVLLSPMGLAVENVPLVPRSGAVTDASRIGEVDLRIASGVAEVTLQTSPFKISGFASGYLEADLENEANLTVRYDSRQKQKALENELFVDWSRGDASISKDLAPSSHALYVSLKDPETEFLYGDYNTAWREQARYTNYQHKVTGLRHTHISGYTGYFFTEGRAVHTESFAATGLAGLYYLEHMQLNANSEQVWLKSMATDLNGKLVEVSRELLTRGYDYKINYQLGSILFTKPIASLDQELNEIWIEVSYATAGATDRAFGYGVRAQWNEKQPVALTLVGGLAGGEGQGTLVGLDGAYTGEAISLTYAGATNFARGYALYLQAKYEATEDITVEFTTEHVRGTISKAGQETAIAEGTQATLAVGYEVNPEYTVEIKTQVQKVKDGSTTYRDEVSVAYHSESDLKGQVGLKSTGDRFGFISQARQYSAFSKVSWRPTERLKLTTGSEMNLPFSVAGWQLQFSSAYDLSEAVTAQMSLKGSMADVLKAKGNWVLGLNANPEGWPNLYGQYRLPITGESKELALGLKQAFLMDNGVSVRINAEGTLRTAGDGSIVPGYAVGLGLGYDKHPVLRPKLEFEIASHDQKQKSRVSLGVTGHSEPGVSYEVAANWYIGESVSQDRDTLKGELRGALAYRDKATTDHSVLAQYLGRTYLLGTQVGFTKAEKVVHASALDWGYEVNKDFSVTVQGATKLTKEKSEDDTLAHQSRIYLAQLGAQYQLTPDYTLGAFGRILRQDSGVSRKGAAVELARRMTEDLTLAVGYSTLDLNDPDLATLVDWPKALYLRLRLKF